MLKKNLQSILHKFEEVIHTAYLILFIQIVFQDAYFNENF